jgi:hypothetical protein
MDETTILHKLIGNEKSPAIIEESQLLKVFRYDSGSRDFKEIPTKGFTVTMDGVSVQVVKKHQ